MPPAADDDELRLVGAHLAARTAHHLLNTPLTLALGYSELLAHDPRLPADLRAMAEEVAGSVETAAVLLRRLVAIRRLVEREVGLPDGPILDLGQSATTSRN
jgi:signal transduction histidine kinase